MADDGKWGLSREEIDKRVRELNQKKKATGPTRGGRSSGQGVKLLYIRDFLYAHATKEHPQNANRIQDFLILKRPPKPSATTSRGSMRISVFPWCMMPNGGATTSQNRSSSPTNCG